MNDEENQMLLILIKEQIQISKKNLKTFLFYFFLN